MMRMSGAILSRHPLGMAIALLSAAAIFPMLFTLDYFNPGGMGLLDLKPYYTQQQAYSALASYGAEGRTSYLHFLIADSAFLLLYSSGLTLLLLQALAACRLKERQWRLIALLPPCIGIADVIEDICIYLMLINYPATESGLAHAVGFVTAIKHLFTLSTLLTLTALGWICISRRQSNKTT